jgi:hypothetical protein
MPLTVSEISFRNPKGAGRKKGTKNRPKWMLDELKKLPKRPRGRPKGYSPKNKKPPEQVKLETWLNAQTIINPEKVKPIVEKAPAKPKRKYPITEAVQKRIVASTKRLTEATPEERKAWREKSRKSLEQRTPFGKPSDWTKAEYAIFLDQAQKEAKRIYKIMADEGRIPENEMAAKSLEVAFEMVTTNMHPRDRLQAVRTVLEYTKQKPASKSDITLKTAEDFLDELAEHDDNQRGEAQT